MKAKTLRWKTIPQHAVENTIWSKASAQDSANAAALLGIVDKSQLEELFTETETAAAQKKAANSLKKKESDKHASVLDNSRARNIEILLRAVKVAPLDIAKAIGGLDVDGGSAKGLDYDALTALRKQWPTAEEANAVRGKIEKEERALKAAEKKKAAAAAAPTSLAELIVSASSKPEEDSKSTKTKDAAAVAQMKLTIAEQFVLNLAACPQVPRLSAKLSLGIFKAEFPSKASRVDDWIQTVTSACAQVRGSSRFGTMLQVVLALGNTLNALGTGKATAGFRLSSLTILANTKSFDDSTSLLQILVSRLEEKQPELLDVSQDMPDIEAASSLSLGDIVEEVKQLASGGVGVHRELRAVETEVAAAHRAPLSAEDLRRIEVERSTVVDAEKENNAPGGDEPAEQQAAKVAATDDDDAKDVTSEKQEVWGPGLDVGLAKGFRDKLQTFRTDVSDAIARQEIAATEMEAAFSTLKAFYGEDPSCTLREFFGALTAFFGLLAKTRAEMADKKERLARKAAAAVAAEAAKVAKEAKAAEAAAAEARGETAVPKRLSQREELERKGSQSAQAKLGNDLAAALGKLRGIITQDAPDSPQRSWGAASPGSAVLSRTSSAGSIGGTPPLSSGKNGSKFSILSDSIDAVADGGDVLSEPIIPMRLEFDDAQELKTITKTPSVGENSVGGITPIGSAINPSPRHRLSSAKSGGDDDSPAVFRTPLKTLSKTVSDQLAAQKREEAVACGGLLQRVVSVQLQGAPVAMPVVPDTV